MNIVNENIYTVIMFIFRSACAIDLQDRVVVTGGYGPIATVQVYTSEGPQEQLPSLQTPRSSHACAYFLDSQDRVVSIACNITAHLKLHCAMS